MADYHEQQRRENQRRWEENQRLQRQRQEQQRLEQQRLEQQRREQERRDQERRANEDRAARKLAAENEAARRRSNQRVLDQQKHQAEMTAQRDKDNEARRQKALRRAEATQDPNWFGPKTENSIQIHRNEPVFPEDFQPSASEPSAQIDLRHHDPFAAIDDFFVNLPKRFWVTILVVGAVAGLIYGWYSLNFSISWEYIEWIGAYSLVGGLMTLFAVALMRPVAKVLLVLAAMATVGGLAWIFYKIVSFFLNR